MTDHRLSSLAILHIDREKEINVESVLEQFAQHKESRLSLCLFAKFAQNKGKTLYSLLVFQNYFEKRNKERSIFCSVY